MRKMLVLVLSLGLVSAAFGQGYANDFDSLDGVATRDNVTDPYLVPQGVAADATATGYSTMDFDFMVGQPGIDITDGELSISLMWSPIDPAVAPGGGEVGMWLRVYSGLWNETEQQWDYNGWQNYAFNVPTDGQWHSFVRDVASADELYDDPAKMQKVYKARIDAIVWDEASVPFTFGIDHLMITPEPGSLMLLGLGGLLLRRRRHA